MRRAHGGLHSQVRVLAAEHRMEVEGQVQRRS
jgi:hypothetical protein